MNRVYLDWNATAPLRPEARAAMLAAMDAVGNPSSVHAEGRAVRMLVEYARDTLSLHVPFTEIIFNSGATEGLNHVIKGRAWSSIFSAQIEHDAVLAAANCSGIDFHSISVDLNGRIDPFELASVLDTHSGIGSLVCLQAANSETGVIQRIEELCKVARARGAVVVCDAVQAYERYYGFHEYNIDAADIIVVSSHKIGGPQGVGALMIKSNRLALLPFVVGGGQELGRRSGTENVSGIAGFHEAVRAASRDLESGIWAKVEVLRDDLEDRLSVAAPDLIIFGKDAPRLPNTSCFAIPGWKGETQVMQMDLAGYAVSAGSACSSGKVNKASRVLLAMGYDEETASSAIRVSMGPTTTEAEVMGFADTWIEHYRRRKQRAA